MGAFRYLLENEEPEQVDEVNATGGGEAYSTPFAFSKTNDTSAKKKKYQDGWSGLQEARTKSIHNIYKNQSPNRKMNLVLLKAARCLKEAKEYLSQLSSMKSEGRMQGSKELWTMSKDATRKAGKILGEIQTLLREIEA